MIPLVFAASAMAAASSAQAAPDSKTSVARTFVETFAANPVDSKKFVTPDAQMIVGDIGGPFDESVKEAVKVGQWLKSCRVREIEQKPGLTTAQQANPDIEPVLKHGTISIFEGAYTCTHPDGSTGDEDFTVILRDNRVVQFYLGQNH